MSSALQTFLRKYTNKKALVGLTAWDYPSGLLAERSGGIDLVHVSDSLGKVILGLQGPISLTLDVSNKQCSRRRWWTLDRLVVVVVVVMVAVEEVWGRWGR